MDIKEYFYATNAATGDPIIMTETVPEILGKPDSILICINRTHEAMAVPVWQAKPSSRPNVCCSQVSSLLQDEDLSWAYRVAGYILDGKIIDYDIFKHNSLVHRVKVPIKPSKDETVNAYAQNRKIGVEWKGNIIKTLNSLSYDDVFLD